MENGHVAIHNSKSRINMSVVYKNSIFLNKWTLAKLNAVVIL